MTYNQLYYKSNQLPSSIPVSQSRTWKPASYGLFLRIPFCVLSLKSRAAYNSIHEGKSMCWEEAPVVRHACTHIESLPLNEPQLSYAKSSPSLLPPLPPISPYLFLATNLLDFKIVTSFPLLLSPLFFIPVSPGSFLLIFLASVPLACASQFPCNAEKQVKAKRIEENSLLASAI